MSDSMHSTAGGRGELVRLAVIGEHRPAFKPHRAVTATVAQIASALRLDLQTDWIATDAVAAEVEALLASYDAIWISPGSPYRSLDGALSAIRFAREGGVPLLGTCGGFQHVVLEYARHVMGLVDAQHAEVDPDASVLVVTPLACSPAGQSMPVTLEAASRVARWYGSTRTVEEYYCNYGLNPAYEADLDAAGLRIVGRDDSGEPRVVDLPSHPFFVGALFVPQPSEAPARPHPLVTALIRAGRSHASKGAGSEVASSGR